MKKGLRIILLCLPMIGFGQACQYGSSTDASELCDFYRGNNFATYRNADIALDKILDVTGMSKRFVLEECRDISNCIATTYKGIRYILYDKDFMDAIATRTNSWSNLSILAHEVGHHVNGHTLGGKPSLSQSRKMELEADEYSGFVMFKLGASLKQAQEAISLISTNADDSYSTHPSRNKRERAIEKGYNRAKGQGSNNNDYSTNSESLTDNDYFYKAFNNISDYKYQIDNYTKAININPNNFAYYYFRANSYINLEKYDEAISDFTSAITLANNGNGHQQYKDLYFKRGKAYNDLKKYDEAISDFTSAIKIDPKNASYYYMRGIYNEALGMPFCSDYEECCDLGEQDCCLFLRDCR